MHQTLLDAHFNQAATYWDEIYDRPDVYSRIHQQRRTRVLDLVDSLALPAGSLALDAGCGAGHMAVDLARRGFLVTAMDSAGSMVETARAAVGRAGLSQRVTALTGNVETTDFASDSFDLIVSLGVLPWLPDINRPLREANRILRPGGYLVATMDNRWGIHRVLDPRSTPLLVPLKQALAKFVESTGVRAKRPRSKMRSVRQMNRAVEAAQFRIVDSFTLGFGPFTFWNQKLLPDHAACRLNNCVQRRLDEGALLLLKHAGAQHIVFAQKLT